MALHASLTGIRLIGTPPLGITEFRVGEGLTVIGGVNGAGKSTLIDALTQALTGDLRSVVGVDFIFETGEGPEVRGGEILDWLIRPSDRNELGRDLESISLDAYWDLLADRAQHTFPRGLGNMPIRSGDELLPLQMELLEETRNRHCLSYTLRLVRPGVVHEGLFIASRVGADTPTLGRLLSKEATSPSPSDRLLVKYVSESAFVGSLAVPVVPVSAFRRNVMTSSRKDVPSHISRLMSLEVLEAVTDPERATTERFAIYSLPDRPETRDDSARRSTLSPVQLLYGAERWAEKLSESATSTWRELRKDQSQELICTVSADATVWSEGRFFKWETVDAVSGSKHPVEQLSGGQLRWAGLAISFALDDASAAESARVRRPWSEPARKRLHWWLMDEPEFGIHRSAERSIAESLRSIAIRRNIRVVASSHSAALMRNADDLQVVRRSEIGLETSSISELPVDLEEIGLDPTDVFGWFRGFLVLEGRHDETVIRGLIGNRLDDLRIKTYCMGGSTKLPGAMLAQFLVDADRAPTIGVLDSISTKEAEDLWQSVSDLMASEGFPAAKSHLDDFSKGRGTEWKAIKDFYLDALGREFRSELSIAGLRESDVLRYVPPKYFSDAMPETWNDVARAWAKNLGRDYPGDSWAPDKRWIQSNYNFSFDDELPNAVSLLAKRDPIPNDINDLLSHIEGKLAEAADSDEPRLSPPASQMQQDWDDISRS